MESPWISWIKIWDQKTDLPMFHGSILQSSSLQMATLLVPATCRQPEPSRDRGGVHLGDARGKGWKSFRETDPPSDSGVNNHSWDSPCWVRSFPALMGFENFARTFPSHVWWHWRAYPKMEQTTGSNGWNNLKKTLNKTKCLEPFCIRCVWLNYNSPPWK